MNISFVNNSYDYYCGHYGTNERRICIDGNVTGSNKCKGYCAYNEHPGFLTESLMAQHNCKGNNCIHFVEKTKKYQNKITDNRNPNRIPELVCEQTKLFEGMKIVDSKNKGTEYVFYYVAIADYQTDKIASKITKETGVSVNLVQIPVDYNQAASLIFDNSLDFAYA